MASPFDRSSTPQNTFSDPSLVESDADKSFSQSTLRQTSQKQLTSNDAAIMQREREIEDIAKGIIELADIFRDLQNMVIDQGTMLDRIDFNVERMTVDVKAADKELIVVRVSLVRRYILPTWPSPCLLRPLESSYPDVALGVRLSAPLRQTQDHPSSDPTRRGHVHSAPRQAQTTFIFAI